MATLKNHPGQWLRDDAAAAFDSAEDAHGIFVVNSAGRTEAEQQNLINRWDAGGKYNRPPYLFPPARPASASNHVRNGGDAVDIGDWKRFAAICDDYGFRHTYPGGDYVHFDFTGIGTSPVRDNATKQRQTFLNSRGWNLVVDGVEGDLTKQAYKEYQTYLKGRGWYSGAIDGIWGPLTQAAHDKFWHELNPPTPTPTPTPTPPSSSNPFGISDVRGLQKIANKYGAGTSIDNLWGGKSASGFAAFLRQNYGYSGNNTLGPVMWGSIARWLRERWGYVGNAVPGPVMRAALSRANKANFEQL